MSKRLIKTLASMKSLSLTANRIATLAILSMLSFNTFAVNEADERCLNAAKTLIGELLPYASLVAGVEVTAHPPTKITFYSHHMADFHYPLAERRNDDILVYSDFCDRSRGEQRAIIAHEIAHTEKLTPIATDTNKVTWAKRRQEIAATAWAIAMYRVAGLPLHELEVTYFNKPHGYWEAVQSYPTYPAGQSSDYRNFAAR